MKIVVTGASGLVGSNLAKKLAQQGHDVLCPVRKEIIIEGCKTIVEDFNGSGILSELNDKYDIFINNIGHISEHLSYDQLKSVNVDLQGKLVEAAKRLGVKRYIQVSSVSVMGLKGKNTPIKENDDLGYGMGYGETKKDGEKLTFKRCQELGIECVALRPTAIYGKSPKKGVSKRIKSVLKLPIRNIGRGDQIWHLVHVEDVSDACIAAMSKDGIDGMVFNIAGPDPMKASEVVQLACKALGASPNGVNVPTGLAKAVAHTCQFFSFGKKPFVSYYSIALLAESHEYDTSRARDILGFVPKIYLRDQLPGLLGKGID